MGASVVKRVARAGGLRVIPYGVLADWRLFNSL